MARPYRAQARTVGGSSVNDQARAPSKSPAPACATAMSLAAQPRRFCCMIGWNGAIAALRSPSLAWTAASLARSSSFGRASFPRNRRSASPSTMRSVEQSPSQSADLSCCSALPDRQVTGPAGLAPQNYKPCNEGPRGCDFPGVASARRSHGCCPCPDASSSWRSLASARTQSMRTAPVPRSIRRATSSWERPSTLRRRMTRR